MFMPTTDDRNHIGNEWTCDKKLSEVDVRSLIYIYLFFAHQARVRRQIFVFAQRLKKNFLTSILMGQSGNRKQDYLCPPPKGKGTYCFWCGSCLCQRQRRCDIFLFA